MDIIIITATIISIISIFVCILIDEWQENLIIPVILAVLFINVGFIIPVSDRSTIDNNIEVVKAKTEILIYTKLGRFEFDKKSDFDLWSEQTSAEIIVPYTSFGLKGAGTKIVPLKPLEK